MKEGTDDTTCCVRFTHPDYAQRVLTIERSALRPTRDFTKMPNAILRSPDLSALAFKILAIVDSHRDGWRFNVGELYSMCREGQRAVRRAIAELVAAGHLVCERTRDHLGQLADGLWRRCDPAPCAQNLPTGSDQPEQDVSAGHTYAQESPTGLYIPSEDQLEDEELDAADAPSPLHSIIGGNQMADQQPALFPLTPPARLEVLEQPGTDLEPTGQPNAGHVVAAFIDFCADRGVKLPSNTIGRYGRAVKRLLADGIDVNVIKRALAQMLADRVLQYPTRLEALVIEAQTGEEIRRAPRSETFRDRQQRDLLEWAADQDRIAARQVTA